MNQITDAMEMVEHLHHCAFCVQNGTIVKVNAAAAGRMIEPGVQIDSLITVGAEEYRAFTQGCLYLTLTVCGQESGFSVSRKNCFDLFQLVQDAENSELQAMALAARELREPLTSIMVSTDHLINPEADCSNPDKKAQIARINRGIFQILRLISNMSDAGRYAASTPVSMEVKNISALIGEIFSKTAALTAHAGVSLEYEGIEESVYGLVNPELLERAILNIISNSLKFTAQGGVIHGKLRRQGRKLYLSIQDTGIGIPDGIRSDLFSRYSREPSVEDGRHGIGLGFVMIRCAAQQHGGAVLVDHPQDRGTRVTLSLSVNSGNADLVRSPVLRVDYAGERDHGLLELSEVLPADLYNGQ